MDIQHWSDILNRLPRALRQLREPVSTHALEALEERLDSRLPEQYRSFLCSGDGGWLGEFQILGCRDLLAILEGLELRGPSLPWVLQGSLQEEHPLLPFHPVSRDSVECLDLVTGQVLWCSFGDPSEDDLDSILGIPPLAIRILDGHPPDRRRPTYEDFLDWTLDALWGLHFPAGLLLGRGAPGASRN